MIIFLKFLQFIFRIIFFLPAGVALAWMRAAGWFTQAIANKTPLRKTVANNIKMLQPQSSANILAKKLISNFSYTIFEVLCTPFFNKKHFVRLISWQGLEHLEKSLQISKGAIILTMHVGNYEIIPMSLAHLGHKMNTVLRATDDPLFEIVNRSRQHGGVKLINILEQDMYKESLNILKQNELIFLLADTGALESRHELFNFLGKEVPVATGWLTLAQRAGCPVIPTLCRRLGRRNLITFFEPLVVTKDNRDEIKQKAAQVFESFVRENLDEWGIFLNTYETERMVAGK